VQVSQSIGLGGRLQPISVYDGPQYSIHIQVSKVLYLHMFEYYPFNTYSLHWFVLDIVNFYHFFKIRLAQTLIPLGYLKREN